MSNDNSFSLTIPNPVESISAVDSANSEEKNSKSNKINLIHNLLNLPVLSSENKIDVAFSEMKATKIYSHKNYTYKINQSISNFWPKFYSIEISEYNKRSVALMFRNNPELHHIINLLILANADYEINIYDRIQKNSVTNMLNITSNAHVALELLKIKYKDISPESYELLSEVSHIQTTLFLDSIHPEWRKSFAYQLDSILDEEEEELQCDDFNVESIRNEEDWERQDFCFKQSYQKLTSEEKNKIQKSTIDSLIQMTSFRISELCNDLLGIVPSLFTQHNRTLDYIEHNLDHLYNLTINSQNIAIEKISNKLKGISSYFTAINQASSSASFLHRPVKLFSTLTKSIFELLIFYEAISTGGQISKTLAINFAHAFLPLTINDLIIRPISELFSEDENSYNATEKLKILVYNFIALDSICNGEQLTSLSKESVETLIDFYVEFIFYSYKNNENLLLEDNSVNILLQNMTSIEYLVKAGFSKNNSSYNFKSLFYTYPSEKIVKDIENEAIDIHSLLTQRNHSKCIENIYHNLSGKNLPDFFNFQFPQIADNPVQIEPPVKEDVTYQTDFCYNCYNANNLIDFLNCNENICMA